MKRSRAGEFVKPKIPTPLNRANPLTRNASVFTLGAGGANLGRSPSYGSSLVGATAQHGIYGGIEGVRLNAGSDYINLGNISDFQASSFSHLIVFAVQNLSAVCSLIETNYPVSAGLQFRLDTTGALQAIRDNTAGISSSSASGPVVKANVVCAAAISYDGTNCYMSLNGLDVSASTTPQPINMGQMTLGTKNGTGSEVTRPLDIFLYAYYPHALGKHELVTLTRNPSMLFAAREDYVANLASGMSGSSRPQVFIMT